jgi:hypothetical protein
MKKFSDLTEREVLTVAIASEDGRIYLSSPREPRRTLSGISADIRADG